MAAHLPSGRQPFSAAAHRSTPWSTRAASTRTMITGINFSAATAAGPSRTCCRIFAAWRYNHQFNDEWHGIGGPLHVSGAGITCQLTEDYILAVQGLGIPCNRGLQRRTATRRRHHAIYHASQPPLERCGGVSWSAVKATRTSRLKPDAPYHALMIEGGRCVGVSLCKSRSGRRRAVTVKC